jgi:hypothetical protein
MARYLKETIRLIFWQKEEVLTFADSDRAFRQAIDANES